MPGIREIYQEVILDHNRKPRNYFKLKGANRSAKGDNPLCGDKITVYILLQDDLIREISFQGDGCALSRASASLMTESVKGKTIEEVKVLFENFHNLVTGEKEGSVDPLEMGKLAVFAGVSEFPVRVKCASLAWHTLRSALEDKKDTVSTE
jgi:nitrogen fixation NifU-like protein